MDAIATGPMTLPKYEDHLVDVRGKSIRYWVEGEGPALVLVHGLHCSAEFWQYNVRPLSQRHRVYALDLVGFGRSDKDIEEFSLPYAASFLADFMDALHIERAALAGNSLGGAICAQFGVDFPARLQKLILVDSAGFGRELHPFLRSWALPVLGGIVISLYQKVFPLVIRFNFSDPDAIDREWIDGAAAMLRMAGVKESSLRVVRNGVHAWGQRVERFHDLHRRLLNSTAPTLIVWGSRDLVVPVSHAYAAQRVIPNAQLQVMDGCGHTPQIERPQEFNQLALDFLGQED